MRPDLFWIGDIAPHRLAIMPRPRAGDWLLDEILGYRRMGISVVVSLLEAHEVQELDLTEEPALCERHGLVFISHPIADRGVPSSASATMQLAAGLGDMLRTGSGVTIHCRAGIGRSGLLAACVLAELGVEPARAFRLLGAARRVPVPDTTAQEEWVYRHSRARRPA